MSRSHLIALSLSLLCALPTAAAEGWMTPATATVQQSAAATAAVQRADGTRFEMPVSLDLLPYGTVELSHGTYMINNYEGSGTTVMIYSPTPLHIATYTEMTSYQARYGQMLRVLAAEPVVTAQPVAAGPTPAPVPALLAGPPAPMAWVTASTQPQEPLATPVPTAATPAIAAPAPTVSVAPQPRDEPLPTTTPAFFKSSFTGRLLKNGTLQITYSIVNRSRATAAKLDPQDLRITQGGSALAARLDARDSSGEPTMLPPSSGEIGTITFTNAVNPTAAVTLEWTVRDLTNNVTYPMRYTFTPGAAAVTLRAERP